MLPFLSSCAQGEAGATAFEHVNVVADCFGVDRFVTAYKVGEI